MGVPTLYQSCIKERSDINIMKPIMKQPIMEKATSFMKDVQSLMKTMDSTCYISTITFASGSYGMERLLE